MDVDYEMGMHDRDEPMHDDDEDHSEDEEMEKSDDEERDEGNEKRGEPPTGAPEARRTLEETMAMFDFGRMGGFMSQINTRLRTLLNNIKATADPTTEPARGGSVPVAAATTAGAAPARPGTGPRREPMAAGSR